MASKWPPVKNQEFIFRCVLFAQSDNQIKSNPTLAAGDWKVSTDGGAFANLATLPDVDPDSSVQVKVSLSADEMNGDEIMVTAIDAAGAEWHSAAFVIHTVGQTLDTMDANIDSILADTGTDGVKLADDAITAAKYDESTAFPLKSADTGATAVARVGADSDTLETLSDEIAALNNLSAAQVNAEVDTALADYDAPTKAELDAGLAGLNDLDATEVQTAAAAALTAYDPPTKAELDAADDAVLAAIAALNNLSSAGAQAAAAAALAAYDAATGTDVSSLSIPTATAIADAVLSRGAANVEDTAEDGSLTELLLGAFESEVTGTTWTIYKSNHATTFNTRTVTVDENADPITSVT